MYTYLLIAIFLPIANVSNSSYTMQQEFATLSDCNYVLKTALLHKPKIKAQLASSGCYKVKAK